ncbi:MAG: NAD(P)/FAD-dependent oxidoreductase [Anaerolineales bacterium]|nr:NAD(P)/FAD-dependent oxidoreductase [Anaerolineales bacterium]
MKAAIIGSGIAGLTAAAALLDNGHEVEVYEQYHRPGGVTATIKRDGYEWDLGQLILEGLGKDEPLGLILSHLGILDKVKARADIRGYVFPGFEVRCPEEYLGEKWRLEFLKEKFPEDANGIEKYWRDYKRFTKLMTLGRRLDHVSGFEKLLTQLKLYLTLAPFLTKINWSAEKLMDYYFKADELKMVFVSILADFFVAPSQFIGLGVFALNSELSFDNRIPNFLGKDMQQLYLYSMQGGIKSLTVPMIDYIEENGGVIRVNSKVERIILKDGKAGGVQVGGVTIPADIVIATGDAEQIFLELVGEENLPAGYAKLVKNQALMDSVFMVHLGLDMNPEEYIHGPVTYYYGTYDLERAMLNIQQGNYHGGKDGFVVHVPTLHSPEMAPEGKHAMTIYTICPDTLMGGSWEELKDKYADELIGYAEKYIPELSKHVKSRLLITPDDFKDMTNTKHHAFGGIAPVKDVERLKFKTPVEGLWFIGQQSESGGGVMNVMTAAWKTARNL